MERENKQESTIYHITHLHPLKLTATSLRPGEAKPVCYACRHPCADSAYECAACRYALDPTCARLPRSLLHPAHPAHHLSLHLSPAYPTGGFLCNACGHAGAAFSFHCSRCQFDLHLPCAALPAELRHPSHPHPMKLLHQDPTSGLGYICDLCRGAFDAKSQSMYICAACDFGGHVKCFTSAEAPAQRSVGDPAAEILAMEQKLMASMVMADISAQGARNAVALTGGPREYRYYDPAPLPSQYAAMANSMVMNKLALLSMSKETNGGGGAVGDGGAAAGPGGGDVARFAGKGSN
ncbi:hypothetical protein Cni_G18511 [Canna indica]|uniref:DC1 domain-containing protein n=1 Tax=Canna indica TaxID=4628 RepID=A0AAQ3KMD7_9LILI|nr:hypothetical protein Cni_G18511 [Canna indica]